MRLLPVGIAVAVIMLVEIVALAGMRALKIAAGPDPAVAAGGSNVEWIARVLFSEYLLPFEVAALILTVGLIAAIPLTLRKRAGLKTQNPSRQVRVRREDRVRLVKMAAETKGEGSP